MLTGIGSPIRIFVRGQVIVIVNRNCFAVSAVSARQFDSMNSRAAERHNILNIQVLSFYWGGWPRSARKGTEAGAPCLASETWVYTVARCLQDWFGTIIPGKFISSPSVDVADSSYYTKYPVDSS